MVAAVAKIENAGTVRESGPGSGRPSRRSIIAALLAFLLATPGVAQAAAAAVFDAKTLFPAFGFDNAARRSAERGEIVGVEGPSSMETELTGAAAMRVSAPPAEIARRLRDGLVVLADRRIVAWAKIDTEVAGEPWTRAAFTGGDRAEVALLYSAEPGDTFNLSAAELAFLRTRLGGTTPDDAAAVPLASAAYREILMGRHRAYRNRGQDGLADYARDAGNSSPAEELRQVGASGQVPPPLRGLLRGLQGFPGALPAGIESRFFWKKSLVDDRPIFVLSQVLVEERPDAVLFALREYYPGHSYNVLQQLGAVVPVEDGSLILAVNSTVTDRVGGALGPVARVIGRGRALDALRDYFAHMREVIGETRPERTETADHSR